MIARFWTARATHEKAPAYGDHLRNHVLPAVRSLDGYAGALFLQREASGRVEIAVITFWQSLDSISRFAGADLESAVVADEAASLLVEFDRRVAHYELVVKDEV